MKAVLAITSHGADFNAGVTGVSEALMMSDPRLGAAQ